MQFSVCPTQVPRSAWRRLCRKEDLWLHTSAVTWGSQTRASQHVMGVPGGHGNFTSQKQPRGDNAICQANGISISIHICLCFVVFRPLPLSCLIPAIMD